MNRKELIAFLKANGYAGALTIDAIKAWMDENGITVTTKSGAAVDVDAVWKVKAALVLETKSADDDAEDTDETADSDDDDDDSVTISRAEADELKSLRAAQKKAKRGGGFSTVGGVSSGTKAVFDTRKLDFKAYENRVRNTGVIADATPDIAHRRVPFNSAEECELFGALVRKSMFGEGGMYGHVNLPAYDSQRDLDNEICTKANLETVFSSGGFSVPEIFSPSLIRIRAAYGAVPLLMSMYPMDGPVETIPRDAVSGATVYSPGEGVAPTEGNPTGNQVKLVGFEMAALATASKRVLSHSAVNFGDFIANSIMWAVAKKLDEIYIYGDGTSTYFNQQGLIGAFVDAVIGAGGTWTLGTNSTNADYAGGMIRAASATWSSITEANIREVKAKTLMTDNGMQEYILCHKVFHETVLKSIAFNKSGTSATEVINGIAVPMWDGIPVIRSNAMPSRSGVNDSVVMFYGDFASGSKVGQVNGSTEMSTNEHRYWDARKIGFQYAGMWAVNVHDIGTATSSATTRTAGPITGLITTST